MSYLFQISTLSPIVMTIYFFHFIISHLLILITLLVSLSLIIFSQQQAMIFFSSLPLASYFLSIAVSEIKLRKKNECLICNVEGNDAGGVARERSESRKRNAFEAWFGRELW